MMKPSPVAFRLKSYRFTRASFDFNLPEKSTLEVEFNPKGTYHATSGEYYLNFEVQITCSEIKRQVIDITCIAEFTFGKGISIKDIPEFFYPNSLAIIFPYIRAFVSTISLQANVRPIVLPTVNLTSLRTTLQKNTVLE